VLNLPGGGKVSGKLWGTNQCEVCNGTGKLQCTGDFLRETNWHAAYIRAHNYKGEAYGLEKFNYVGMHPASQDEIRLLSGTHVEVNYEDEWAPAVITYIQNCRRHQPVPVDEYLVKLDDTTKTVQVKRENVRVPTTKPKKNHSDEGDIPEFDDAFRLKDESVPKEDEKTADDANSASTQERNIKMRRRLTVEARRLAEDSFANSHPFLVLFAGIFFVLYILAILISDRLVTRAKRDAMQRAREWNFSDCVKAWISKRLNAM